MFARIEIMMFDYEECKKSDEGENDYIQNM